MIIGIDLGTTNSLVSYFSDTGPQLIPNALGDTLTPSAVYLDKSGIMMIGAGAKDQLVNDAKNATARFKRLMGTSRETNLGRKSFKPEDLSAMILRSLKSDAEDYLKQPVTEAVISVPAYFNDIQRKATINAAELAGLSVARLINEPTAAALAYGLHSKEEEDTFLVVDLGGGTFDVSILEMFSGVMEVRSSAGDAFLGGEDFTDRIVGHFCDQLSCKVDDLAADDLSRLRAKADQAKHALSNAQNISLDFRLGENETMLTLTRPEFERACVDLLSRMKMPLQKAVNDAELSLEEIDRIVLVGGATRMPIVHNLITKLFKRFPEHELDPDRVIALGAAVQAGLVARNAALDDVVMTDVSPFTLGYETSRQTGPNGKYETGLFEPLIERNTTIPVSRNHVVSTMEKGQKLVRIDVYQGESPYVKDNIKIGTYNVEIPYNATAHEEVDIRFTFDNSGVLEVISKVLSTQKESKLIIESNPGSRSRKDIEKRFKELEKIKIHPREETMNAAFIARLKAAYENALGERRSSISMLLSEFEAALGTHDRRKIDASQKKIEAELIILEEINVFD
ncbi:molecular chaperone HscC [Amylibacter marinus]|uniref:Molecular chaperone HscC n=1 Tax=Amylibacter marinus TaxID=1475483 RepID=A0ABQ5VRQ9_9RHOB|nr:molecular chaperone HscC [Amylibacter marinus]GLQ34096.1 molecular chaperone HscC [Amylibacter marinus]